MDPLIALLAAAVGYLLGSISFARVVTRLVSPETDIGEGVEMEIPGTDETVTMDAIAGTTVATRLGDRYGCATAIGDILKVTIPTLAFRFAYPGESYFLITAALGVVGHDWPLYYRFKGGRGLSPIYGGFLAVDPIGMLVTALAGMVLGLLSGRLIGVYSLLVAYSAGTWLMIPWLWFRTQRLDYLAYVVFVNLVYLVALIPDIRMIRTRLGEGLEVDPGEMMANMPMGRGLNKMARRFGLAPKEQE